MKDLIRPILLLAGMALIGATGVAAQPEITESQARNGVNEAAACNADAKAAYLECVEIHDCDSHPLTEKARTRCDTCWQTYQKDNSSCAETTAANQQPSQALYPSKKRF